MKNKLKKVIWAVIVLTFIISVAFVIAGYYVALIPFFVSLIPFLFLKVDKKKTINRCDGWFSGCI